VACLTFDKRRKRWRVFWQVYRGKVKIFHGSRTFFEKSLAISHYGKMEDLEKSCRSGVVISPQSVAQAKEDFFRYIKKHTQRTQEGYLKVLTDFSASIKGLMVEQVETGHIQEYLYKLRDRNLSARTMNNHLIAIKAFLRFCADTFKIANVASAIKLFREEPPEQRFLTESEYQKILTCSTQLAADRLRFVANTGLRASEFASLIPDCIRGSTLTVIGKGRKRRSIPMNAVCLDILQRYPDLARFAVTRSVFYNQCQRVAKKAKIPVFGPHSLRHHFATALLLKGVPIKKVSILLGHASVQTTERTYAHILPDDLKNITDCLI